MTETIIGWEQVCVQDIATVLRGSSPRPKSDPRYYGGPVPRLMVADISRDGKYVTPKIDSLTQEGAKLSRPVPKGTLTIVCSGITAGDSSILATDACIHDGLLALANYSHLVDVEFLYYTFQWRKRQLFNDATHGGAYTNLTTQILREFTFPIPPISQQHKIAEILSAWDEAIAATERLIAALQQRKKGLMQRLLTGQVRFAGFDNTGHQIKSEFPLDWKIMEFGDFVSKANSKFNPASTNEVRPCIELEHLSQETGKILGNISSGEQKSIKNAFQSGQVLFGKLRPYLKKYARPNFDGVCSSEIWVLDGKKKLCSNSFLYYLVQTDRFISVANVTSGTKMPRADWSYVSEAVFDLPSLAEQEKISSVLHAGDAEIELNITKLELLKQQKKGLMQRLLTGQVRVTHTL